MNNLTPEERQRIYLEEKARHEVRKEIEGKKTSAWGVAGMIVFCVIGFVIIMAMIGSGVEDRSTVEWNKLSPQQKHEETVRNCTDFRSRMRYKLYSEMSQDERKMFASCAGY